MAKGEESLRDWDKGALLAGEKKCYYKPGSVKNDPGVSRVLTQAIITHINDSCQYEY